MHKASGKGSTRDGLKCEVCGADVDSWDVRPCTSDHQFCVCGHTEGSHTDAIVGGAWIDYCHACGDDPEHDVDPWHRFDTGERPTLEELRADLRAAKAQWETEGGQ